MVAGPPLREEEGKTLISLAAGVKKTLGIVLRPVLLQWRKWGGHTVAVHSSQSTQDLAHHENNGKSEFQQEDS